EKAEAIGDVREGGRRDWIEAGERGLEAHDARKRLRVQADPTAEEAIQVTGTRATSVRELGDCRPALVSAQQRNGTHDPLGNGGSPRAGAHAALPQVEVFLAQSRPGRSCFERGGIGGAPSRQPLAASGEVRRWNAREREENARAQADADEGEVAGRTPFSRGE